MISNRDGLLHRLAAEGGREGCQVIATSALGVGVGLLGLPILTIGLFMAPLHAELGWTRAQISGASTCINLATICAAPFIGSLCDTFGVRRVALASLTALMLGLFALAAMNTSLTLYYVIWFTTSVGAVGTSGIVWTRAVGTFFERNRGQALGLALTGTAFAALLAPLLLGTVITDFGWRSGYLALGCVSLLTIPVAFLFFRERRDNGSAQAGATIEKNGVSLAEATRDPKFWVIGISIFLSVLGMGVISRPFRSARDRLRCTARYRRTDVCRHWALDAVRARHHRRPSRPFEPNCRFVGLALYASLGLLPAGSASDLTNCGYRGIGRIARFFRWRGSRYFVVPRSAILRSAFLRRDLRQ